MLLACLLAAFTARQPAPVPIEVALQPCEPQGEHGVHWASSERVPLRPDGAALAGSFDLGAPGSGKVLVRLSRAAGAEHYDQLGIDSDRDGRIGDDEQVTGTLMPLRGGGWRSGFVATVQLPILGTTGAPKGHRPYPMSLWYVEDPRDPVAALWCCAGRAVAGTKARCRSTAGRRSSSCASGSRMA
ncbi:MAG TPA: hypothetical protein VK348_13155 [Planctomycetota bacterium]|nr:hypothetical protein [Planctomycetota bacterium]